LGWERKKVKEREGIIGFDRVGGPPQRQAGGAERGKYGTKNAKEKAAHKLGGIERRIARKGRRGRSDAVEKGGV